MGLFSWLFKPKPTPKEIFLKEVPKKLEQASNPFYRLEHVEKPKSIKKFKGNLKADFSEKNSKI